MAVDPKNLVAAISPDTYCDKKARNEVKKIVKEALERGENDAYLQAAEKAELAETDFMDFDKVIETPFKLVGLKNPIEQHTIEYETSGQAIEQLYFWLHDYMENRAEYGRVEKLVDNFISSPGSAHFSEMGMKATKMQEEGIKIMGVANQLVRSILNIIYDLKEFRMRLDIYDQHAKEEPKEKESAYLSLKQIWLDQVDIKRGNSSIKALAVSGVNQPSFVMLIDAFMAMKSLGDLKKWELNDRINRILEARFNEFTRWIKESERELRKRYEIEKIYLKSQLNSVKLYSRWAKPYLKAAAQLEQRATATSALVTAFSTSLFELTLFGAAEYKPETDIARGELPKSFKDSNKRKYAPVVLVELKFRSVPERHQGGYGFKGKAYITFTSFALNADEQRILREQLEWDGFKDVYQLVQGATEESLGQLQSDIDYFLNEPKQAKKKENSSEDTNPFTALFSVFTDMFKKAEKPEKKEEKKENKIKPDSDIEKVIRSQAVIEGRRKCSKFYGAFKKSNNSPAL